MANLVTKAEYKAYAGISSTTQDTLIDFLIPKISDAVRIFCRNPLLDSQESISEIFEGGNAILVPSSGPVASIASVQYSTDYGKTFTDMVQYIDWIYVQKEQVIKCVYNSVFQLRPAGYKVTYLAGNDGCPEGLKLGVLEFISYYMRHESTVHSNAAPGGSSGQIEYIMNSKLPASIQRIFDQYALTVN
jgi:hypothetical protein